MNTISISENDFQRRVLDYAALRRVRAFHSGDSRRDNTAGYPDLTLCGPGGVAWVELKTATGRISTAQRGWLADLQPHAPALLARPGDWETVRALIDQLAKEAK